MSQSTLPDQTWESMTQAEKAQAIRQGQATLEQMRQGVLDGPDDLRRVCWEVLAHRNVEKTSLELTESQQNEKPDKVAPPKKRKNDAGKLAAKQRFGLPKGFVPRTQRAQTNILLLRNVYRMPNGQEVVPCEPTGTLGRLHHLYALLTLEQYKNGSRGSTYVRADGRVFDYSFDDVTSGREMFDTGLTIRDLERTGSYVNTSESKRPSVVKLKRAAHFD